MDNKRIACAARWVKDPFKEAAAKITGDTRIQAESAVEKIGGKVWNATDGAKKAVHGAAEK
jgi:uncharacterized protein YjbJ (UPF0337 family)